MDHLRIPCTAWKRSNIHTWVGVMDLMKKWLMLDGYYPISEARYLSEEDIEKLNNGETINAKTYSGKYCFNIQNILEGGYDADYAIENDESVIWYEGGWDYGQYVEYDVEEEIPMMGLTFDLDNSDEFAKNLEDLFEDEAVIERKGDIFHMELENSQFVWLAMKE